MSEDKSATIEEVFIPKQVRDAARRSEELQRQLNGETPPPPQPGEPPQPPQPQPQPGEPPQPPPREPPPPQPAADWEQRYRTLQGKYDSEIGAMRGQIQNMERLLSTVQSPTPAQTPAPATAPPAFNSQDVELYGQDLLDAIARTAEARYGHQIADLQNQIRQLTGSQGNLSAAAHQEHMFRELDSDPELAGRWRHLNTDKQFLEWLQTVDEYSGLSRNEMLQHAFMRGDAPRTGRFFKRYLTEHTVPPSIAAAPQTGVMPAPYQGNGQMPAGRPRLEDMAAPGRPTGPSSGNGAPSPRIWSRRDIRAFYRDRTAGKYRGREDEAARLEADLFAAEREGRIE